MVAVDERVFVEVTGPRLARVGTPRRAACMVVTVRDGRIVPMQDYPDRAAALAAAGLPPEPVRGEPPPTRRRSRQAEPGRAACAQLTEVIRTGDAASLQQLLREHPGLATARLGDPERGQSRTLLHVVTDWPGHVPAAAPRSPRS